MEAFFISLLTSVASNPNVQSAALAEVTKLAPSLSPFISEVLGMLGQQTAPSPTTKTITAGPSQTVKNLQKTLNAAGASPKLVMDGYYGPKTDAALRAEAAKLGVPL